jgi:hypothetical protein
VNFVVKLVCCGYELFCNLSLFVGLARKDTSMLKLSKKPVHKNLINYAVM